MLLLIEMNYHIEGKKLLTFQVYVSISHFVYLKEFYQVVSGLLFFA